MKTMKNLLAAVTILFAAGLFISVGAPRAQAQHKIKNPEIVAQIKGLACPFCAYGLEKKIKKMPDVAGVYVGLNEGIAQIKLKKTDDPPTQEQLKKAVKDAGFTLSKFIKYPENKTTAKNGS